MSVPTVRYEASPLTAIERFLLQEDRESAPAHEGHCPEFVNHELQAAALHPMLTAIRTVLAHEHPVTLVPREDGYGVELLIHPRLGECECGRKPEPAESDA